MTLAKRIALWLFAILFTLSLTGGFVVTYAWAEPAVQSETPVTDRYYGAQLTDSVQKKFYAAMREMDFTTGNDYAIVSGEDVEALALRYVHGDKQLLADFGAASDCFYFDYPELFYVDFDLITLSVSLKNGSYLVRIGAGRSDSYFKKGVTKESVRDMLATYNEQMEGAVSSIQSKIDWAKKNWNHEPDKKDIVTFISQYLSDRITYGFCVTDDGDDTVNSTFIRTTYGALVVRQCVCEGYARLFKALCDRFNIECVLIFGDYVHPDGHVEPHGWNAVKLQNSEQNDDREYWYGVDPTFEDSGCKGQYLVVTGTYLEADHFPNPVISSSGYELGYPVLKQTVIEMPSGLLQASYVAHGDDIYLSVSYAGMDVETLRKEKNLYLAMRVNYGGTWSAWSSIFCWNRIFTSQWIHNDGHSEFNLDTNFGVRTVQLAVFDVIDDAGLRDTGGYYNQYSEAAVKSHMVEFSNNIDNQAYDPYYVAPAYIKSVTYSYEKDGRLVTGTNFQTSMQELGYEYFITVKYTQPLKVVDESIPVTLSYTVSQLDGFRTTDLSTVYENSTLKELKLVDASTISFKFMPSPLYQHNKIWYTFQLENVVNKPSGDKQVGVKPNTFATLWGYTDTIVCTKCLGGGRYLLDNVYAQPALVDDGDLSTTGWTYQDDTGKTHKVSESQRSNLALVVTTPTGTVTDGINANLANAVRNSAGNEAQMLASKTYEVDLQICGQIVSIPNGSYLKIKLGYPAGFDYSSMATGTTFKLYHFKRDAAGKLDYANPEEIECVFTEVGIIALVESFSPYTLVALEGAKPQAETRSITTQFNGLGGEVNVSTDKPVVTLKAGEKVTYSLCPYEGYDIEYALLNGAPVAVTDGSVQLSFEDLPDEIAASIFSVGYVSKTVKNAEAEDTTLTDLSLAYIANAVQADAIAIDNSATTAEVLSAVTAATEDASQKITGEAQNAEMPALAPASQQTTPQERVYCEITFDTDGGTPIAKMMVRVGAVLNISTTKEGLELVGWEDNLGNKYDTLTVVPTLYKTETDAEGHEVQVVVTSISFKANWAAQTHTMSFDTTGGTPVDSIVANGNSAITAPQNPTRKGYTFEGWLLDGEAYQIPAVMPEHDVALTAKWTALSNTITFDSADGSEVGSIVASTDEEIALPTPTKTGYTFAGWLLDGEVYTANTMPGESVTLVAKWTANEYTVTFDTKGGSKIAAIKVKYNDDITAPQNPTKQGYKFNGWQLDGKQYTFGKMPAGDITVTATWVAENPSSGSGSDNKDMTMLIVLGVEAVVVIIAIVVIVAVVRKRKNSN